MGYPVFGPRAIRADVAEQVSQLLRRAAKHGSFSAPPELETLLGCENDEVARVIRAFGFRAASGGRFQYGRRRPPRAKVVGS
jgi:ATP-dependent RNA helicase SUPV3L1/SUV3